MRMTEQEWLDFLDRYFMRIRTVEDTKLFLDAVLTHSERAEVPQRFKILQELFKEELPQHKIASKLGVSIANITRGVNTIRSIQAHYDLKKLIERMSDIKDTGDEWLNYISKELKIDNLEDARVYLNVIFTHAERDDIPKRIQIFEELFLNSELSQREIAEKLKVSVANVSRGVNVIKSTAGDLKGLFVRVNKASKK